MEHVENLTELMQCEAEQGGLGASVVFHGQYSNIQTLGLSSGPASDQTQELQTTVHQSRTDELSHSYYAPDFPYSIEEKEPLADTQLVGATSYMASALANHQSQVPLLNQPSQPSHPPPLGTVNHQPSDPIDSVEQPMPMPFVGFSSMDQFSAPVNNDRTE